MHSGKFRLEATPLFGMELEQALNYIETQLANPVAADKLQADVESAVRERLSHPRPLSRLHPVLTVNIRITASTSGTTSCSIASSALSWNFADSSTKAATGEYRYKYHVRAAT